MTTQSERTFQDIRMREMSELNVKLRKLLDDNKDERPTLYIVSNEVKKLFEKECQEQGDVDFGQPKALVSTMFGIRVEYGGTDAECGALSLIRQSQGERPRVVVL